VIVAIVENPLCLLVRRGVALMRPAAVHLRDSRQLNEMVAGSTPANPSLS